MCAARRRSAGSAGLARSGQPSLSGSGRSSVSVRSSVSRRLHDRRHRAQLGGDGAQRRLQHAKGRARPGAHRGRSGAWGHAPLRPARACWRLTNSVTAASGSIEISPPSSSLSSTTPTAWAASGNAAANRLRSGTLAAAGDRLLHHSRGQPPGAHRCAGAVWRLAEQVRQRRQHGQAPEVCRPRRDPDHDRLVQAPQPVRAGRPRPAVPSTRPATTG